MNNTFRIFVSSTLSRLKEEWNVLLGKIFPKLREQKDINMKLTIQCPQCDSPKFGYKKKEKHYICRNCNHAMLPKTVFISYGRKDALELARKLEKDLHKLGHNVWLDKSKIRSGKSWEEQIEKAILHSEIFISLLSPHAVRRPDGVCLDEISLARYNQRKIIPAMVLSCKPPLGIYRLDWVDFQGWEKPGHYERAFGRLLSAISSTKEQVEGIHAHIFGTLNPLDFGVEEARLTHGFTGRKWITSEIEIWLRQKDSRVFFITGDPGTGKSAFIAYLSSKFSQVYARHYCVSNLKDSLDPILFVKSIAAQLSTQLLNYRNSLNDLDLEQIVESDAGTLLRRLIADPLKVEKLDTPILLLVDALDESLLYGTRNIAKILSERLNDLPDCFRLVITSRKEPLILDYFSKYQPYEIETTRQENLEDISTYINIQLQKAPLSNLLKKNHLDPKAFNETISRKGEGNFLYVTQVIEGIKNGTIDPCKLDVFPQGLVGLYQQFFDRIFPDGQGFKKFRSLLDIITAAYEPLSPEQIADFLNRDRFEVENDLSKLAVFFPQWNEKYQAYHKSITDWLIGIEGYSRIFRVNVKEGHRIIAEKLLVKYSSGERDKFTLAHLSIHLTQSEKWDDLEQVLTDLDFLEAKCATGMTYDLVKDYELALGALPEAQENKKSEMEHKQRIQQYIQNIIQYSNAWSDARERYWKNPKKYPLPSSSDIPLPEIPPSRIPWTEEKIEEDIKRIIEHPLRLDKIKQFSNYINAETHNLVRYTGYPQFFLQQAYNSANTGLVHESARKLLDNKDRNTMKILRVSFSLPPFNPHPALLRTLEGPYEGIRKAFLTHNSGLAPIGNSVRAVRMTTDGRIAVSAYEDGMLRVWELTTGECIRTWEGHLSPVFVVAITPDGQRVVSGGKDGTLRVWELTTGKCIRTWKEHSGSVSAVAITPDGRRVVSGSSDTSLKVWDISFDKSIYTLNEHRRRVNEVAITPDGHYAISVSDDYEFTLRLWDLTIGKCIRIMNGHTNYVMAVAITPDARWALSGSEDNTLKVWDIATGKCVHTLQDHKHFVHSVAITPDGQWAISGSWDLTLRMWNITAEQCIHILEGHSYEVTAVAITADARLAVSGSMDLTLKVWNLTIGKTLQTIKGHSKSVKTVVITPDGRFAISGSWDKTLKVWELSTGECISTAKTHQDFVSAVAISPDGRCTVSGDWDGTLWVRNLDAEEYIQTLREPLQTRISENVSIIDSVIIIPDSRWIVSGSQPEEKIQMWDPATGNCIRIFEGLFDSVRPIGITPDGRSIVSGFTTIRVYDLVSEKCIQTLEEDTLSVYSLAITPDGKYAVSGDYDMLRVWDLVTGKCEQHLKGHNGSVNAVAITADGRLAVSGSYDTTLRVWDLVTGKCLVLIPHQYEINSISIFKNKIVVGDEVGYVTFYEITPYNPSFSITTATRLWNITSKNIQKTLVQTVRIAEIDLSSLYLF